MIRLKLIAVLAAGLVVAGCATYDAPFERISTESDAQSQAFRAPENADTTKTVAMPSFRIAGSEVVVPQSLTVSEANSYYPRGDIVWRGDPPGNRHNQIKAIFDEAIARAAADMDGDVPVTLYVKILRFHGLTEKTRYTVGGVHSIQFEMTLRHKKTGLPVTGPRVVQADLLGYGGARAVAADHEGQTQKVRITSHLTNVIEVEMTDPEGFENPRLGLVQVINNRF